MNKKIRAMILTTTLAIAFAGVAYAEAPATSTILEEASIADSQIEQVKPSFYPTDIEMRQDGDQTLVVKSFVVPAGTVIADLEESNLTCMGKAYALWGISENRETTKIEEADVSKVIDVAVPSNIPEQAVASLQQDILYDQDGYFGTLKLVNVACTDMMLQDGTYPATAEYKGTVSRVTEGDVVAELIYAPVATGQPVEVATAAPAVPMVGVLVGGIALLAGVCFAGFALGKKKQVPATPAPVVELEERPRVYVPANDIVVGAHEEDDDE